MAGLGQDVFAQVDNAMKKTRGRVATAALISCQDDPATLRGPGIDQAESMGVRVGEENGIGDIWIKSEAIRINMFLKRENILDNR